MPADKFNALKGFAGAAATTAMLAFSSPSEAQVPSGPAPGSHAATAQACIQDKIKAGKTSPQEMQSCMASAGPRPRDPAAAMGVTPEQFKAMQEQRARELDEARRSNGGSDMLYKQLEESVPQGKCADLGKLYGQARKIDEMQGRPNETAAAQSAKAKIEAKCGVLPKAGG